MENVTVPVNQKFVAKPWGHEIIFAHTKDYVGKILFVRAGQCLSLQFHQVKEETIFLSSGRLKFQMDDASGGLVDHVLEPGMSFHIPPNRRHRMIGISDCTIFEVSTPHLDDVVRLQDQYGRAPETVSSS